MKFPFKALKCFFSVWLSFCFAVFCISLIPSVAKADMTAGLIGYWNMDQGSGTTAIDGSGNNNNGTLTNGPIWTVGRVGSGAINFGSDGNDVVTAGNPALFNNMSAFSISLWVKPAEIVTEEYLVSKLHATNQGWKFSINTGNNDNVGFYADFDGAADLSVRSAIGSIHYNEWQHVVMTWDGSAQAAGVHFYINGEESALYAPTNGAGNRISEATKTLKFGNNTSSRPFQGDLDEVRLYNRVISGEEVEEIYNASGSGTVIDITPPNITDVSSNTSTTQATISWTTNEPATSQVLYGLTSTYSDSSSLDTSTVTSHQATLTGLSPNTLYHFQILSTDAGGNTATSTDFIFGTKHVADGTPTICGLICTTIPDNSTWVFLGDSITNAHGYSDYIEAYFHLRYPDQQFHFRGIGKGGTVIPDATTGGGYDSNVFALSPDFVSVMYGHNGPQDSVAYEANLIDLTDNYIIAKNNATPIYLGPHPQNDSAGKPILGVYSDIITQEGTERGFAFADIWHYLHPIWLANLSSTTPVSLQGVDVTHPGPSGHLAIAYALLSRMQAEGDVSAATINAENAIVISENHAQISNVATTSLGVDFTRLDDRLPMAFDDYAREIFKLMPEVLDLNKYMLTVTNLEPGLYEVYVDGVLSASTTAAILQSGWNMTEMRQGPIHDQLVEVLGRIRDKEGISRVPTEGGNNLIGKADIMPRQGVADYKSDSSTAYNDLGLRGQELKDHLAPNIAEINNFDALIKQAAEPVSREFSIRKVPELPDTEAPSISITAPTAGSAIIQGSNTIISATASDNVAVVGVQFVIDAVNAATEDTSLPYSLTWNDAISPASPGTHILQAVARDVAGNTATSTVTVEVVAGSLIGEWNFNEGSGVSAIDAVSGNNGTLLGVPSWVSGHVSGGALQFDGIDDRVRISDAAVIRNMSPMSISLWVKANELAAEEYLVSKLNTTSLGWRFSINTGNNDNFGFMVDYDGTADLSVRSAKSSVTYGVWQHVVMTWDGSASASGIHIYINGVESTPSFSANPNGNRISDINRYLVFGANQLGGRPFSGTLDDIKIYNKVLTSTEVTQLFNQ